MSLDFSRNWISDSNSDFRKDKTRSGPPTSYVGWRQRLNLFGQVWQILVIFFLVIGGIYLGWFTPTEGASIGAAGTGIMALFTKGFNFSDLIDVIKDTAVTSAMIFLVLLGAEFFNSFIALTQITMNWQHLLLAMSSLHI